MVTEHLTAGHYAQAAADLLDEVERLTAQLAADELSLQAVSLFVRDIIEALGQSQPPLDAKVNLPEIAIQVVGQIEELKAQLADAIYTRDLQTARSLELEQKLADIGHGDWSACRDRAWVEQKERADKAEAQLAAVQQEREWWEKRTDWYVAERVAQTEELAVLRAQQARLRELIELWRKRDRDNVLGRWAYRDAANELDAVLDAPEPPHA